MNKHTYESWSRAISFGLKLMALVGIIFVFAFWAITGRVELAFLPFLGTLAAAGLGIDAYKEVTPNREDPPSGPAPGPPSQ